MAKDEWWSRSLARIGRIDSAGKQDIRWHKEPKWINHNQNARAKLIARVREEEKRGKVTRHSKRGSLHSQYPKVPKVVVKR